MNHLQRACSEISPGQTRLLFCEEPCEALLRARYGSLPIDEPTIARRFVAIIWRDLPVLRDQLAQVLLRFAELSQALYPAWAEHSEKQGAWRAAAAGLCKEERPPLVKGCLPAMQLRQLALTVGLDLVVLFVIDRVNQARSTLAALTRTVEWTARNTDARVALILPSMLRDHQELHRLAYRSLCLDDLGAAVVDTGATTSALQCEIACWPMAGRPHGLSPGEQRLAVALRNDTRLCSLFSFNQRVKTTVGSTYCVDLLWRDGRVVVEVDGYTYHGGRAAFAADRQRDYELVISGYLVIRLTHDEIWLDVMSAVRKIHNAVEFVEQSRRETDG